MEIAWRRNSLFLSVVFFVLTTIAMIATYGFFKLIEMPGAGFVTAAICLALAEWLIRRRYFFGTGIESALWLGGLFAFIFGLPGEGRIEALLLFAAAAAVAGLRVRNALFGALASAFVIAYVLNKAEAAGAALVAIAFALTAGVALARRWQRPSTEALFVVLTILPPVAAAIGSVNKLAPWWAGLFALIAAVMLALGLRLRSHAPLIAAAVNGVIAIAILTVHELIPLEPEWRLMIGGATMLAASALIARSLRDRTSGIVTAPSSLTTVDDELQMLGTVVAQPHIEAQPSTPEGGRFGGAGSTGEF
jgi:hypothetical protein